MTVTRRHTFEKVGHLKARLKTIANKYVVIKMITGRLAAVRKKQQMIADANSKVTNAFQQAARRRSGDITPRSVPSHASS